MTIFQSFPSGWYSLITVPAAAADTVLAPAAPLPASQRRPWQSASNSGKMTLAQAESVMEYRRTIRPVRAPLGRFVLAGVLTAIVDGCFSSVLSAVFYGSTVARLFQGVASTLL